MIFPCSKVFDIALFIVFVHLISSGKRGTATPLEGNRLKIPPRRSIDLDV